jgi:putative CocE/NonD family hydrolase
MVSLRFLPVSLPPAFGTWRAKRAAELAAFLIDEVVEDVGPAQWVFTIPKMLRVYFLYHRELLGELSRAAAETVKELLAAAAGEEEDFRPGIVAVVQTFGDRANFHPHVHALVTRGGWTGSGDWVPVPYVDEGSAEELFRLGAIAFGEDTAARFREDVLIPFLRRFLVGDETVPAPAPVTVFETGVNRWRHFDAWPPRDVRLRRLYLQPGGGLAFAAPPDGAAPTEYVSDPAKPIPYEPRPNWNADYGNPTAIAEWRSWLVQDQRFVDGRPDVATWRGEPLAEPVTVRGPVKAVLFAETTGTDADWVVKLIDVFPDDEPSSFEMSGYELMVSADIFRGRYRESREAPRALEAGRVLEYTIPLPSVDHTFRPGHRLMVQVQSTWFPLYDRNPQTFVPSIMSAPASAYRAARQRIHHSAAHPTHLELLVDERP